MSGLNVFGEPLEVCCTGPTTTGFYRDGFCNVGPDDVGVHAICCKMTAEFLAFSKAAGNDLSTPRPEWGFPGLKPGDHWCVCAARWQEAFEAGIAPPIWLASTHEAALQFADLEDLRRHALDYS